MSPRGGTLPWKATQVIKETEIRFFAAVSKGMASHAGVTLAQCMISMVFVHLALYVEKR